MFSILRALLPLPVLLDAALAASYHVDSISGDDSNTGLTPGNAWKSLARANAAVLTPGDSLLFKAGGQWSGQFKPRGSGNATALVKIGRYGDGPPPRIDGGGRVTDAVLLENIACVELADLEVTNLGVQTAPWRSGVKVAANGCGRLSRIYLRRLHVHDVNGDLRKSHEGCGIFFEAKGRAGTHFDGLLIESCRVERTDRNGICQRGHGLPHSRNVIIRGNKLEDIGGDGIKLWSTDGGLIENNTVRKARARCDAKEAAAGIWPFDCDDTVIQFNEVSGTVGTTDGQAYDSDYSSHRTVFQYNYSFRNEGGFMLVCTPGNSVNEETVIRYNISVHDGLDSARVFHFGGGARGTHVYNNTIIIGPRQRLPMLLFTEWDRGKAKDTRFTNNLFVVEEGGLASYQFGPSSGNVFERNLFAGRHEGLPDGTSATPGSVFAELVKPEVGTAWLKALKPARGFVIPRGTAVPANGGRDFFGTPLPRNRPPAIGAVEMWTNIP